MVKRVAVALLLAACAAHPERARDAAPTTAPPADPLLAYVLTYAPFDPRVRDTVADIARTCDDAEAQRRFDAMGEPARRALESLSLEDSKFARLAAPWLARLDARRDEVLRRNLNFDVGWLETAGPGAATRLDRILPPEASRTNAGEWMALHGYGWRWSAAQDRFVAWEPWPADESPLRFGGRDFVRLADTMNLVSPGSAFTAEMWVRWPDGNAPAYLVADDAWPGMDAEHVPVTENCGWTLRGNRRGPGVRRIQFVAGGAPFSWFATESPDVPATGEWEHLAVVSNGSDVRVFLNGDRVAGVRFDGERFFRAPTNLYLGAPEFSGATRGCRQDVRAFRLSEGARYAECFTPPQRFEDDGATLVLPDFTAGAATMRDLSGHGHDGTPVGPQGQATLTPRLLAAALHAQPQDVSFFEGESGLFSGEWYLSERPGYSGGVIAEIWSDHDVNAAGHWGKVPFTVTEPGRYRVHFAGASLHRLGPAPAVSPFAWRIDDGPWTRETEPLAEANAPGPVPGDLSPLGETELAAGRHVFTVRLLARRESGDNRWSIWFDGVALERVRQ